MNKVIITMMLASFMTANVSANEPSTMNDNNNIIKAEKLTLTTEWDKTFPKSNKVAHDKVTFVNRYGITLAADLYVPHNVSGKLPAIAVSGPFGAVKTPL